MQTDVTLLSSEIRTGDDVVRLRKRARQIAGLLGFGQLEQTQVATAVSEIGRNSLIYARDGHAAFILQRRPEPMLMIRLADRGSGIPDLAAVLEGRFTSQTGLGLGIAGARRLMDRFDIQSTPGSGTRIVLGKLLPRAAAPITQERLAGIVEDLARTTGADPLDELQLQNAELLRSLESLTTARRLEKEAQGRLRFLTEASRILSASLEYTATLEAVARLAVPFFADWCVVDLVGADDVIERVAMAAGSSLKPPQAKGLELRYPLRTGSVDEIARVLFSGQPEELSGVPGPLLKTLEPPVGAEDPTAEWPGRTCAMIVPLTARSRVLGAMTFVSTSGRHYDPEDLDLAKELGNRAAIAVDNAHLYRQALQAIRSRDDLMAMVSHDLRNPLNAIQLGTQSLALEPRSPRGERALSIVQQSCSRMNHLIEDLLDYSRLEAGQFTLDQKPTLAGALVEEAFEALVTLGVEKSLQVRRVVDAGTALVLGDWERLLQVFSNLIGNAIKFTEPGGDIVLRADNGHGYVRFSVQDSGCGIAPEDQGRVFDRHWHTTDNNRRGSGLGLAISKGIVEAHGGQIGVESVHGEGSTFYFRLPVLSPA